MTNRKQNTLGARLNTVELAELKSFCLTNFAFFKTLGEDYYVKKVEPKDSDKLVDQTGTPPGKRGAKPKKKGNK